MKLPKLQNAASKDNLRPAMQGIFKDDLWLVATDGYILVRFKHQGLFDQVPNNSIIKPEIYKEICALKEIHTIQMEGKWLKVNDKIFTSPFISEKYPDYQKVLDYKLPENVPSKIGLNIFRLGDLYKTVGSCGFNGNFMVKLQNAHEAIHLISEDEDFEFEAIVLPITLV